MVYVVIVYDVQADRTHQFLNFLRQYLTHVQNSVFEGDITEGDITKINQNLESMLEHGESVIVYQMSSETYVTRTVYGEDPAEDDTFLSSLHRPPGVAGLLEVDETPKSTVDISGAIWPILAMVTDGPLWG